MSSQFGSQFSNTLARLNENGTGTGLLYCSNSYPQQFNQAFFGVGP
jgi:hypothetical protein